MEDIKLFSSTAINIIIHDILKINIITPQLVFDYSEKANINQGYYMYKNASCSMIILNMNEIEALKDLNDMKTVITYGFIHEILHMFQEIKSDYFKDPEYHVMVEDATDYDTIDIIRDNIDLIQNKLNFEFNEIFLIGIERQLEWKTVFKYNYFKQHNYICNTICGALFNKININYDATRDLLIHNKSLKLIFKDTREIDIDLFNCTIQELNQLIDLIYLEDIRFIHIDNSILNTIIFKIF